MLQLFVATLTSLFTYGSMRSSEGDWSEALATAAAAITDRYDVGDLEGDLNDVALAVCTLNRILNTFWCASGRMSNQYLYTSVYTNMSLTLLFLTHEVSIFCAAFIRQRGDDE